MKTNILYSNIALALCLSLLMPFSSANAVEVKQVQKSDYLVGPWQLGMTSKEVSAFESYGPYVSNGVAGGIETVNVDKSGKKEKTSFVFGTDDRLDYIENLKYEGSEYQEAKKAVFEIFELFTSQFGGAEIVNIKVNEQGILDRESMNVVLDKIMGTAPELSNKISSDAAKDGKKIITTFVFDLIPRNQPSNCRLHSQLMYSSKTKQYKILLYQDASGSKSREVKANINTSYDK